MASDLVVKVEFGGELRRLPVAPPTFAVLAAAVASAWPALAPGFRLVAVDDEGDRVSVFNDASFAEAQEWARRAGKLLRLEVQAAAASGTLGRFTRRRRVFAANKRGGNADRAATRPPARAALTSMLPFIFPTHALQAARVAQLRARATALRRRRAAVRPLPLTPAACLPPRRSRRPRRRRLSA
jgi:hypothetical protein